MVSTDINFHRKISLSDDVDTNIVVSASPTGPKPLLMDGMTVDGIVAQNLKKLMEYSQAFLNRITDLQMVEEMPKEIRYCILIAVFYINLFAGK